MVINNLLTSYPQGGPGHRLKTFCLGLYPLHKKRNFKKKPYLDHLGVILNNNDYHLHLEYERKTTAFSTSNAF
jgi:hypothetical protein